jgi:hypothetical protein
MPFDIEKTVRDMINAVEQVLKKEWPKVDAAVEQVLRNESETLQNIAMESISGNITESDSARQIEDEKVVIESALAMLKVINKVMIQDAVNAALDVFWKAVKAAL